MQSGYYYRLLEKGFLKEEDLEPELGPFEFYLEAFSELSSCRSVGMALGPIPFTAIVEYAKAYDIGDFEDFNYLIRRMDHCTLQLQAEKKKSDTKKDTPSGPTNADQANQNLR